MTPIGALMLNLSAGALWDGGKYFSEKARSFGSDKRQVRSLVKQVSKRADVEVGEDVVVNWLADNHFWLLLGESMGSEVSRESALKRIGEAYMPDLQPDHCAAVVTVIIIEVSTTDPELQRRLELERLFSRFDIIEHGLGYVIDELRVDTGALEATVSAVGERVDDLYNKLVGPSEEDDVERALLKVRRWKELGLLEHEVVVTLQYRIVATLPELP